MDEELINKILDGTKNSSTRKQIKEANLLFDNISSKLLAYNDILKSLANPLGIEISLRLEGDIICDIETISNLLDPNFVHSSKKTKYKPEDEKKIKFAEGSFSPNLEQTLSKIINHLNDLEKSLKTIAQEISNNFNYDSYYYKYVSRNNESKNNTIEDDSDDYVDDYNSNDYYDSNENYCGACMESPCMCS